MRGRPSVSVRAGRVGAALATRPKAKPDRGWDLGALSDDELETLLPLSEKWAAARAAGEEPAWTAAEAALLARLWAKASAGLGAGA